MEVCEQMIYHQFMSRHLSQIYSINFFFKLKDLKLKFDVKDVIYGVLKTSIIAINF